MQQAGAIREHRCVTGRVLRDIGEEISAGVAASMPLDAWRDRKTRSAPRVAAACRSRAAPL